MLSQRRQLRRRQAAAPSPPYASSAWGLRLLCINRCMQQPCLLCMGTSRPLRRLCGRPLAKTTCLLAACAAAQAWAPRAARQTAAGACWRPRRPQTRSLPARPLRPRWPASQPTARRVRRSAPAGPASPPCSASITWRARPNLCWGSGAQPAHGTPSVLVRTPLRAGNGGRVGGTVPAGSRICRCPYMRLVSLQTRPVGQGDSGHSMPSLACFPTGGEEAAPLPNGSAAGEAAPEGGTPRAQGPWVPTLREFQLLEGSVQHRRGPLTHVHQGGRGHPCHAG